MAKINVINNATQDLTIDPGAAGDSYIQYSINGTGEFRIGVDDTDDSFRISQGSALGTNDTFIMDVSGHRTLPLQPAFFAYLNAHAVDVTGDGTAYTVAFNAEVYDQNSDFNTGTHAFTAPITGRYYFAVAVYFQDIVAHTKVEIGFVATGNYASKLLTCNGQLVSPSENFILPQSAVIPMTAADTLTVVVTVSGSTKTVNLFGGGSPNFRTLLMGYLLV